MKTCSTCKQLLPAADFYVHTAGTAKLRGNCKACQKQYVTDYQREHPVARARWSKTGTYGLTRQQIECMESHAVCALCGKVPSGRMEVDHNHTTGQVRGWIHGKCNRAIGLLGDSAELALLAYQYLSWSPPNAI
jgi:hypothetical protein